MPKIKEVKCLFITNKVRFVREILTAMIHIHQKIEILTLSCLIVVTHVNTTK